MTDGKIKCQWCDGIAVQSGTQRMGFGVNHLSYKCQKCKAIALYIRHTNKTINAIEYTLKFEENSQ